MAMKGTSLKDHLEEQINTIKSCNQNNKVGQSNLCPQYKETSIFCSSCRL